MAVYFQAGPFIGGVPPGSTVNSSGIRILGSAPQVVEPTAEQEKLIVYWVGAPEFCGEALVRAIEISAEFSAAKALATPQTVALRATMRRTDRPRVLRTRDGRRLN